MIQTAGGGFGARGVSEDIRSVGHGDGGFLEFGSGGGDHSGGVLLGEVGLGVLLVGGFVGGVDLVDLLEDVALGKKG